MEEGQGEYARLQRGLGRQCMRGTGWGNYMRVRGCIRDATWVEEGV